MLGLYVGLKKYNEYLEMVKASRVASISVTVDFKHISQGSGSRFLFFNFQLSAVHLSIYMLL
jgi:hypothetical protein